MDEFVAPEGSHIDGAPPEGEIIHGTAMDVEEDGAKDSKTQEE